VAATVTPTVARGRVSAGAGPAPDWLEALSIAAAVCAFYVLLCVMFGLVMPWWLHAAGMALSFVAALLFDVGDGRGNGRG
jgi:ABC-type sulfate transport system permease component